MATSFNYLTIWRFKISSWSNKSKIRLRTCRYIGRLQASDSWRYDRRTSRRSRMTCWCRTERNKPSPAKLPRCEVSSGAPGQGLL